LIYILAWNSFWTKPKDLEIQDVDGYTALHLAVKSAEELKNSRPIRALLFRGASKDIRDNQENLPIDIAKDIKSITLRNEIIGYLNNNGGILDCCMLKTPLRKVEKSLKMAFYFISLNMSVYVL
jgi:ankyrin repeat protein